MSSVMVSELESHYRTVIATPIKNDNRFARQSLDENASADVTTSVPMLLIKYYDDKVLQTGRHPQEGS
jgi:hypothetical protein